MANIDISHFHHSISIKQSIKKITRHIYFTMNKGKIKDLLLLCIHHFDIFKYK